MFSAVIENAIEAETGAGVGTKVESGVAAAVEAVVAIAAEAANDVPNPRWRKRSRRA